MSLTLVAARGLCTSLIAAISLAAVSGSAQASHYDHLLAPRSACSHQEDPSMPPDAQEPVMGCMHNYARVKTGLQMVIGHQGLMRSADAKSADILRCQSFSHTACGRHTLHHFAQVGYLVADCWGAAENIAMGSGGYAATVRSLMSGWLHSDDHRKNILDARPTHMGLALRTGEKGPNVWTAHFGWHC